MDKTQFRVQNRNLSSLLLLLLYSVFNYSLERQHLGTNPNGCVSCSCHCPPRHTITAFVRPFTDCLTTTDVGSSDSDTTFLCLHCCIR